jgi:hypothetical protein
VTYTVYSDSACSTVVATNVENITTPGALPPSGPVALTTPGTYYWQASYSGDSANAASKSSCGSGGEVESVTSVSTTAEPTNLETSLSSNGSSQTLNMWSGRVLVVSSVTSVTDSAVLSGANASQATGTVTYTVYALVQTKRHRSVWEPIATGGTVTVSGGVVPASTAVTLPRGIYEWQASYSGDSLNGPSSSRFGSETEIVIPAPQCHSKPKPGFNVDCKAKKN